MPFKKKPELYSVWQGMRRRCRNPNAKQWSDYGGRGISICERWNEFRHFIADMGPRKPGYTIERINNNGNYEPTNCRWASRKEQLRNRRVTLYVTIDGVRHLAKDLADLSGLKVDTIMERAQSGLPYQELISPKRRTYRKGLALGAAVSSAKRKARTHCKRGHEYTQENTATQRGGARYCRACHALRERQYRTLA